jgi:Flp pilus assembly protein TadG
VKASTRARWRAGLRWRGRRDDSGYIAVATAILTPVLLGLAAFTVDVGNWYVTADQVQRAADAAALAGVTYLPGNLAAAEKQALATASANGYTTGGVTVVDPEPVSGNPNQLRVTITTTVDNTFGQLLGKPTETIKRSAVATSSGTGLIRR